MEANIQFAPCKINLTLGITAIRNDGYHTVNTVMQTLRYGDDVVVRRVQGGGIRLLCNNAALPVGEENIAHRAATLFFKNYGIQNNGIEIEITKRTPLFAGLGGGSSDGAAVLRALNTLYAVGASRADLQTLGGKIGADVPFLVGGGTAFGEGIGEIITPLPPMPPATIVLCKPQRGVSTAACFARYDKIHKPDMECSRTVRTALETGDLALLARGLYNVLEEPAALPEIGEIKTTLLQYGALAASMTGSGSTVFGIFTPQQNREATACVRHMWEKGYFAVLSVPYTMNNAIL